jgi:hypothetical protein
MTTGLKLDFNFNTADPPGDIHTFPFVSKYIGVDHKFEFNFYSGSYTNATLLPKLNYDFGICEYIKFWEYENLCVFKNAFTGQSVEIAFIVDKNYNFDFNICLDNQLDYLDETYQKLDYIDTRSCPDIDFEFKGNTGTVSDSTLKEEKNLNFDITICDGVFNPDLDSTNPTDFVYFSTWDYECDAMIALGYSGAYADCTLLLDIEFKNVLGYSGQWADSDIEAHVRFQPLSLSGAYADCDFWDNPVDLLQPVGNSGQWADSDLENNVQFDPLSLSGAYADSSMWIQPLITFDADGYSGAYADGDLEINPSESMDVTFWNTSYSVLDSLAVTFALYPVGYSGHYAGCDLSYTTTFNAFGYSGAYADCDFTNNPFDELEPIAYNGNYAVATINVSKVLFPRAYNGNYADCDFTIKPSEEIHPLGYSGAYAVLDELDEDTFFPQAYNGNICYVELGTEQALDADGYSGTYAFVDLAYETRFKADGYSGTYAILDELYIHPGEELETINYVGQNLFVQDDIKIHQTFNPKLISVGQAMYDGFGGVGGLNFCTRTTNYPATDTITFDVRGSDPNPWDRCGPKNRIELKIDLSCNIRFEFDCYSGEYLDEIKEQHFTAFGNVPDDVLYGDRGEKPPQPNVLLSFDAKVGTSAVEMNSDPDDYLCLTKQMMFVDLEDQPFAVVGGSGETLLATVRFDIADWRYAFNTANQNVNVEFFIEPEYKIRFCPGYLRPLGERVSFEFASVIKTDCMGWFGYSGESAVLASLSTISGLAPRAYSGQYFRFQLATYPPPPPWLLRGYSGEFVDFAEEYPGYSGEMAHFEFYAPPYVAANGSHALVIGMVNETPSIKFTTPQGCLENQYMPLTEDGDIDYTYEQLGVAVEFEPFWTKLESTCTDEYIYRPRFRSFLDVGESAEIQLSVYQDFKAVAYSGAYAEIDYYVAVAGEHAECELMVFHGAELENVIFDFGQSTRVKMY